MKDKLEKLFEPIDIGAMGLKNRMVMSPMATGYSNKEGEATSRLIAYYVERAKYGVGMITLECTAVSATGKAILYQLGIFDDDLIPGLKKLADAIREHDCKSAVQLHHAGRRALSKINQGLVPDAPSPIPAVGYDMPRELTVDEIGMRIEEFADAAVRAKKAGFDAVELHGAHGYILAQFLSPLSNKRTDKYGGSLENRARFPVEIIQRIREKIGKDYPVLIKMSVDEYLPGGLTPYDTRIVARIFQEAGADAIVTSAGHTGASAEGFARTVPGASFPRGCNVHLSQAIKEAINIPVGAVGRINDPVLAEDILEENKADLIYLGRALIAAPEFPAKAKKGKFEDIRTCIACSLCNKTMHTPVPEKSNMRCTVNAANGREETYKIVTAARPKKVLVVGGGPAGLEAARVAALRGHKVYLYDKGKKLGGQLLLASIPPHKDEIPHFLDYLTTQIDKLGITVELDKEVNLDTVKQLKPDAVVMATGSTPCRPDIPGIDSAHVVLADDVLAGKAQTKPGAVVIIGGGIVGCETAEFLVGKGIKEITIIEMLLDIAEALEKTAQLLLKKRLTEYGVSVLTDAKVQRITRESVVLDDGREIKANAVVISSGRDADKSLMPSLKGAVAEVYTVGDCAQPRQIMDAITEGSDAGLKI
ncbi:FAD-dependent oxidoreductase [Chloroflexota bacterium]